ncbi:MAG: ComEC family competence protein, partial [Alphaproteobacteria bacterium]|nr:ComEC family competence protein [Alphaproteobacteria bacterium]
MGIGIALYFSLRFEPEPGHWLALGLLGGACLALLRIAPGAGAFGLGAALVITGLGLAGLRAHMLAGPVLGFRYYGPVEGRIIAIDRSASDKVRLTLDRVVLKRLAAARTPHRVRVSLHGQQGFFAPVPGQTVILTGHLAAPSGPAEPGGFDFQRHAWFQRLGAVGYTRTPALLLRPAEDGARGLFVQRLRQAISARVQEALPGRTGTFAAAITTGDRSGMDTATLAALRASNLAHLLAISGLHMGLLTGFVFAAIRLGLALVPWAALRWPCHKIAAGGALVAGAIYLALSGGNVATERAFIMVAMMFLAVLFSRRAITLRAVALAAVLVLTLRPEALMGPGFQMSFAATTALVAAFGAMRGWRWQQALPGWARPVLGLFVSSLVAGLATAPIAAAHFNQVPHYGLIANLVSVPLMGAAIIPAAVLAALLSPFGLEAAGLALMAPGIDWILAVADRIAGLPGALSRIVAPPGAVLPLIALGGLWAVLWRGPARHAGPVAVLAAFALWSQAERPALLISSNGGLLGLLTEEGRALSKPRGDGFTAGIWLENDGDPASQDIAAQRAGIAPGKGDARVTLGPHRITHLTGRGAAERVGP